MSDGFFTGLGNLGDAVAQAEGNNYVDPPEGHYKFEVVGGELRKGTKKNPDVLNLLISYDLSGGDKDYQWTEWLGVPDPSDGHQLTEQEGWSLNALKTRFLSLGVDEARLNSAGPDDIEGVTGTLELRKNKGGYLKARNVKVSAPAAPSVAPAQAVARPVTRKAAPKAAPAGPSEGSQPTEAPAPQRPTQAIGNPFAK